MSKGLHVTKNDQVLVTCGNHKGKRGRILKILRAEDKIIVEGINYVWKHVRPTRKSPRGGRIQIEAPIAASNVLLICANRECPSHDKAVRTKAIWLPDGTKTRGCIKCGAEIARRLD